GGRAAPEGAPADQPAPGATMVYKAAAPPPEEADGAAEVEEPPPPPRPTAALTIGGRRHELDGERTVIGRSKDCDVQVQDPSVSRRHAEVQRAGDSYVLVDLDSTNGIEGNGNR